jgi:hypothetical protein
VLAYHNDSLFQALVELFPDIGFNKENLFGHSKFYHFFLFHLSIYKYKNGKIHKIEESFLKIMPRIMDLIHSFLKIGIL